MDGALDEFDIEPEESGHDLTTALRILETGMGTSEEELESKTQEERIKRYHRYTKEEKIQLFDVIMEKKFRDKKTWDEIGADLNVARSTIRDWRRTDEWRMSEARWRRILREENRSDASEMGKDALGVMQDLMHNARSEFVRYSAAGKIIDILGIGDELEETKMDQTQELNKFTMDIARRKAARERMMIDAGLSSADDLLSLEVKPGGMLPDAITKMNEALIAERMRGDVIDAEFRESDDKEDKDAREVDEDPIDPITVR